MWLINPYYIIDLAQGLSFKACKYAYMLAHHDAKP